jgi:hypothetical protein
LAVRIRPRRIEFAEVPAESDKLWVGQLLILKDDDKALAPDVFNSLQIAWRDRARKIDPANFSAERRVKVPNP